MIELVGEMVPFAAVIGLSPLPIIAVLLLLAAPAGLGGGALFALGRVVTLALLVFALSFATDLVDDAAGSTTPAAVLRVLLGLALVAVAVRKWLTRPRDHDTEALPGWMRAIDTMRPGAALRLGVVVTVANPKELAMAAGAGLTLGGAMAGTGTIVAAGAVFVLLATLGATLPVLVLLIGRERVAPSLGAARDWFVRNNATIMAIVLLVIGALLIGGGLEKLG